MSDTIESLLAEREHDRHVIDGLCARCERLQARLIAAEARVAKLQRIIDAPAFADTDAPVFPANHFRQ